MVAAGIFKWDRCATLKLTLAGLVAALGASMGQAATSVTLAWDAPATATDIAGYNLYCGTVSRSYPKKVTVGNATSTTISNLVEGQVYYFAATTYSSSGLESEYSVETVFTNTALAFTNVTVLPGSRFACAVAAPAGSTGDRLTWSLEPGTPAGATINATNGTFSWKPTSEQASSVNTITVRVTDLDRPALSSLVTLVIGVGDYFAVRVGSTSVEAGQNGSVPLYMDSSAGVSNLTCTIGWPGAQLVNPSFSVSAPGLSLTSFQNRGTNLLLTLQMAAGQVLQGSNQIGVLNFQTALNQSSAFLPLPISVISAAKSKTVADGGCLSVGGEVAVIGDAALLRAGMSNKPGRTLSLYGKVGARYQLQYSTSLGAKASWVPLMDYTQTSLVQTVSVETTNALVFYRLAQ